MVSLVQYATQPHILHARANYDILQELWALARRPDFVLHKVQAHQLRIHQDSQAQTWIKLGNEAADRAAKSFLRHVESTLPLDLEPNRIQHDIHACTMRYSYLHVLQVERAKLFQTQHGDEPIGNERYTWDDQFLLMQQWQPQQSVQYAYPPEADRILPNCV